MITLSKADYVLHQVCMRALLNDIFTNKTSVPELAIEREEIQIHSGPTMTSLYRKPGVKCPFTPVHHRLGLGLACMSAWRGVKQHQVLKLCLLWYLLAVRCNKVFPIPKNLSKFRLYSLGDIPTVLNLNSRKFPHSKTHGSAPTTKFIKVRKLSSVLGGESYGKERPMIITTLRTVLTKAPSDWVPNFKGADKHFEGIRSCCTTPIGRL